MKYVYILQSEIGDHFYVGITDDLRQRLKTHNAGHVSHTSKFKPWHLKTYLAFSDEKSAFEFEKYLKSGSTNLSGKQIAAMAGDIARRLLVSDPNLNEGDAIAFVSNIPRIVDLLGTGEVKTKWQNAVELFELNAEQGLDHHKSSQKIRKLIDGFVAQALFKQVIVAVDNQPRLLL
jgi:putative endonuclease